MQPASNTAPRGDVKLKVIRAARPGFRDLVRRGLPSLAAGRDMFLWKLRNIPNFWRGLWRVTAARLLRVPHFYGIVSARVVHADGSIDDYGVVSLRVITTAGVNAIVDAFQSTFTLSNFKYHGFGSGTTAEAAGNTALVSEFTTQYAVNNTRPTGTQTEGDTINVYKSVASFVPDANVTVAEHGLFSQAATGGGTLLDRTVFGAVSLIVGDTLQVTYECTFTAGG